MTEDQLQTAITDLAEWCGFRWFHDVDSRKNKSGFPDLVLVHNRTGRTIFVELKSATGKLRPEQGPWLQTLGLRNEVYLWRPADWTSGLIRRLLLAERTAPVPA